MNQQINKTMALWLWGRKPDLAFCGMKGWWVRILQGMRVNQETKYCGEVISDDVQLWTETGDMSEPNVTGEKHGKNLKTRIWRNWKQDY